MNGRDTQIGAKQSPRNRSSLKQRTPTTSLILDQNFISVQNIDSQFTKNSNIECINEYTDSITKVILFPTSHS